MKKYSLLIISILFLLPVAMAQTSFSKLEKDFLRPPAAAKPWVFWYWMQAAVSKAGITADLEAMKEVGIGGAYLMPIKDSVTPPLYTPVTRQLSDRWWEMVGFAMSESKRLGLQLAMHYSDGFALGGGPWITPEMSMQKLVWTKTYLKSTGATDTISLDQPEAFENYYRDVAVMAYPAVSRHAFSDTVAVPAVTASDGSKPSFLAFTNETEKSFRSDSNAWVMFRYPYPFTCRSVRIHTGGNNYQSHRLIVQSSDDGENFTTITRLVPPRHGWQDTDEDVTHAIPSTTARYLRFVYDKEGTEPGSEDLDAAKWKPTFKVKGIYLSDEPVINQFESKNGSVWRVSRRNNDSLVAAESYVPLKSVIDLSTKLKDGKIVWKAPPGNWVIVRIGHTSTGHTNATGGGGKGLETDKFNPAAITLQFNKWFGQAFSKTAPGLAPSVLKIFHVDSWECGSQNWTGNFLSEFRKRRGYDLRPWLLTMTGVPLGNARASENVLHDVRMTVADLINDVFYATLKRLAKSKGCNFTAEAIATTMLSDGLRHYSQVDVPMGEFWLNSPTHDKPNDMLDAISGAHIYGKNIVQAEAFTSVRMNWSEHPGNMKSLGDRNFALGINKMVMHVFTHNPWTDRKPGMTLDGVGLYFQRDQTWFKQGKAWMDYFARCQAVLQTGKPVVDIAVFTGEELPRRALLPSRLTGTLPGLMGSAKVETENKRMTNDGQPLRQIPDGVTHSANMADPEQSVNALNGYHYDSFNPDVLMKATVVNKRVVFPGGASYAVLVFPYTHSLLPDSGIISLPIANRILQLLRAGATVMMHDAYFDNWELTDRSTTLQRTMAGIGGFSSKGTFLKIPYVGADLSSIGVQRDVDLDSYASDIAWTHRKAPGMDIYFLSNQRNEAIQVAASFRVPNIRAELWDAVTGERRAIAVDQRDGRAHLSLSFPASGSWFVIFSDKMKSTRPEEESPRAQHRVVSAPWQLLFDTAYGGPVAPVTLQHLTSWTGSTNDSVKFYSGTAVYRNAFDVSESELRLIKYIQLDSVYNLATVKINGKEIGTIWTSPYRLALGNALRAGTNQIEIEVTNTWANRLMGDQSLPADKRVTWTTAPFRLAGKPLQPAGLVGDVKLIFKE